VTAVIDRLRRIFNSLTIRVVVILTIGMASAATISILITETARVRDFQHAELERLTLSVSDIANRYALNPAQTDVLIRGHQIFGFRDAPSQWRMSGRDPELEKMLNGALGKAALAQAMHIRGPACYPTPGAGIKPAGMNEPANADCWFIRFVDGRGVERKLGFDTEPVHAVSTSAFDPIFLLLILIASAGLSWLTARFVVAPLKSLTEAARTFSLTTPPHAIPEVGPNEVRLALQTFNIMQEKVTEGFKERTADPAAPAGGTGRRRGPARTPHRRPGQDPATRQGRPRPGAQQRGPGALGGRRYRLGLVEPLRGRARIRPGRPFRQRLRRADRGQAQCPDALRRQPGRQCGQICRPRRTVVGP
jgi:HAMP domain-containing protein